MIATASWLLYHAMVLNTINHLALYICIAMQHNAGADLGLYRSSISQIQLLYKYVIQLTMHIRI